MGSAIRVLPSLTNSATTPSSRRFTSSRKAGGNDHSRPTSKPTFNVITLPPVNRGRQCSRQDDRKGRLAGRPQGSPLHILPPINRGRQCSRQDDRKGRPYMT